MDRVIWEKRRRFEAWKTVEIRSCTWWLREGLGAKSTEPNRLRRGRCWTVIINAANGRDNVFRVAKQMKRENRDIVGEQSVRDDVGRVVVGGVDLGRHDVHIKTVSNIDFDWDKEALEPVAPVC